ncbi:ABC transporter substrate-binding protein [Okibacterium endophyticum]
MIELKKPGRSYRRRGAAVVALAFVVALAGCSGGEPDTGRADGDSPQKGGTLTIGSSSDPVSLDPAVGRTDVSSQRPVILAFERLVEVAPDSTEIVPGLAESWELNEDRTELVFHLRASTFSDGTPVTSEDVKFSLERLMDPEVSPNFAPIYSQQIAGIETPDEKTVVLLLDGPQPALTAWLTFPGASIISQKAFEKLGTDGLAELPTDAGSGPFKIVSWERGQVIRFERNSHYREQGKPYLDAVEIRTMPDDNSRMLAARSGDVDVVESVPYSQIESLKGTDLIVEETPVASVFGPWLASTGPMESPEVRQALHYATPKESIQKVVFGGTGEIPNSAIPPMLYWDESIDPVPYDIEKAKELLSGSPTPDGFEVEMLIVSGDSIALQTAQILQEAWKEIGVVVDVRALDEASVYERNTNGDWEIILFGPGSMASHIPTEDEFAGNWATPHIAKFFQYDNPELTDLMAQASSTWDESERTELFSQAQQMLLDDPPIIPILFEEVTIARSSGVNDFVMNPLNWLYLTDTWLSQ